MEVLVVSQEEPVDLLELVVLVLLVVLMLAEMLPEMLAAVVAAEASQLVELDLLVDLEVPVS